MASFSDKTDPSTAAKGGRRNGEKPIAMEKILFETLYQRQVSDSRQIRQGDEQLVNDALKAVRFDDEQLRGLNAIMPNLPFDMIKLSYDGMRQRTLRSATASARPRTGESRLQSTSFAATGVKVEVAAELNDAGDRSENEEDAEEDNMSTVSVVNSDGLERARRAHKMARASSAASLLAAGDREPAARLQAANSVSSLAQTASTATMGAAANVIVIHVCDENKNLKQDFTCPRDLLIREMKYFSHNLNSSLAGRSQTTASSASLAKKSLDEIDISVHCDINIFDWLMRYVKRDHPQLLDAAGTSSAILASAPQGRRDEPASTNSDQHAAANGGGEPRLEVKNCVSILLSSDFLLMGDLVDKCILFIVDHLEPVLQISSVMSGIKESLVNKIAVCLKIGRLDDLHDKKDKIKTKLFQRRIEFLFEPVKYREQFEQSTVLSEWRSRNQVPDAVRKSSKQQPTHPEVKATSTATSSGSEGLTNYVNYLFECENDASTLFRCKLCSCLMTKQQSLKLKCHLAILNAHGEYVYLHMPDERFELTQLLALLKERLKSWQSVYWFLWALIKASMCKKCGKWFRLVDLNKCRLNDNTFCFVHDTKTTLIATASRPGPAKTTTTQSQPSSQANNSCTCIYCDHVIDHSSLSGLYASSPLAHSQLNVIETSETRLAKYCEYVAENLDKHKNIICYGRLGNANADLDDEEAIEQSNMSFCNSIESVLAQSESSSLRTNHLATISAAPAARPTGGGGKLAATSSLTKSTSTSIFIDSITGKHIFLLNKNLLNLIKLSLSSILLPSGAVGSTGAHSAAAATSGENAGGAGTAAVSSSSNAANSNANSSSLVGAGTALTSTMINSITNINLDFYGYLSLINHIDSNNAFNCLDVLHFLKVDPKMKWDLSKPIRLNQDNQREDDLKRFREISSYLIKAKLLNEHQKAAAGAAGTGVQRSAIAAALAQAGGYVSNPSSSTSFAGGIYCRVEYEWKHRGFH